MSLVTRSEFVTEARTWLDTPYQHQGRLKGIACDCIGLLIETGRALGLTEVQFTAYDKRPDGNLRPMLEQHLEFIPLAHAQAGDVALFAWNSQPLHVAIFTDSNTIIHAYLPSRRVVENTIDDKWRALIAAAYHIPGIT